MDQPTLQLTCDAMRDAIGTTSRGGSLIVRDGKIAQVLNPPPDLPPNSPVPPKSSLPTRHIKGLLMPAMVNVHAHLDLTSIGSVPYTGDFMSWGALVMDHRATQADDGPASVAAGVIQSRQAGVGYIGDIAGSVDAALALAQSGMPATSFLECFGSGERQAAGIARLHEQLQSLKEHESDTWQLGVQPHAPYSAGLKVYSAAVQTARRVCTHLAEMPEEIQFVRDAAGPIADRLKNWGKWDDTIKPTGLHPINWLASLLKQSPWLLAHCNYVDDNHIAVLQRVGASIAYCPIASDYFGHKGHRYRDMIAVGINVCLGTDSILCQPSDEPQPMSILAQMRHLYQRDQTDPQTLLAMATLNGAVALGFSPKKTTLAPGAPARFMVVPFDTDNPADPLTQVLQNRYPVSLLDLTH